MLYEYLYLLVVSAKFLSSFLFSSIKTKNNLVKLNELLSILVIYYLVDMVWKMNLLELQTEL